MIMQKHIPVRTGLYPISTQKALSVLSFNSSAGRIRLSAAVVLEFKDVTERGQGQMD